MEIVCLKCNSPYSTTYKGRYPVCSACRKYFVDNTIWEYNYKESAKGGVGFATDITKKMGATAEMKFVDICKKQNNYRIRGSTKYEETKLHYDFVVEIRVKDIIDYFRIEVKSIKSRKRGELADPNITFVKYKNVNGGPGWLYGESDYIAFEQIDHFLVVLRKDLVKYSEEKKEKIRTIKKSGIVNTLYSRNNRSDLIGCFSTDDIKKNNRYFTLSDIGRSKKK